MVHLAPPNCQHLDNWRRCRVHKLPWWQRWLVPGGRPPCILDVARYRPPQDGEVTCPDQKPRPLLRPVGPSPVRAK